MTTRMPDPTESTRQYRRGAVMGLTVAEAFMLLAFVLLMLMMLWRSEDTGRLAAAKGFTDLPADKREAVLETARKLQASGLDPADPIVQAKLASVLALGDATPPQDVLQRIAKASDDERRKLEDLIRSDAWLSRPRTRSSSASPGGSKPRRRAARRSRGCCGKRSGRWCQATGVRLTTTGRWSSPKPCSSRPASPTSRRTPPVSRLGMPSLVSDARTLWCAHLGPPDRRTCLVRVDRRQPGAGLPREPFAFPGTRPCSALHMPRAGPRPRRVVGTGTRYRDRLLLISSGDHRRPGGQSEIP